MAKSNYLVTLPNGEQYVTTTLAEAKAVERAAKAKHRRNPAGSRAGNAFAAAVLQKAQSYEGMMDPAFWKAYGLLLPHGGDLPDRNRIVYFFDNDFDYEQDWATDKNIRILTGHSRKEWDRLRNKHNLKRNPTSAYHRSRGEAEYVLAEDAYRRAQSLRRHGDTMGGHDQLIHAHRMAALAEADLLDAGSPEADTAKRLAWWKAYSQLDAEHRKEKRKRANPAKAKRQNGAYSVGKIVRYTHYGVEYDLPSVWLQSYGWTPGKLASELRDGDVQMYNWGVSAKISGVKRVGNRVEYRVTTSDGVYDKKVAASKLVPVTIRSALADKHHNPAKAKRRNPQIHPVYIVEINDKGETEQEFSLGSEADPRRKLYAHSAEEALELARAQGYATTGFVDLGPIETYDGEQIVYQVNVGLHDDGSLQRKNPRKRRNPSAEEVGHAVGKYGAKGAALAWKGLAAAGRGLWSATKGAAKGAAKGIQAAAQDAAVKRAVAEKAAADAKLAQAKLEAKVATAPALPARAELPMLTAEQTTRAAQAAGPPPIANPRTRRNGAVSPKVPLRVQHIATSGKPGKVTSTTLGAFSATHEPDLVARVEHLHPGEGVTLAEVGSPGLYVWRP